MIDKFRFREFVLAELQRQHNHADISLEYSPAQRFVYIRGDFRLEDFIDKVYEKLRVAEQ